MKSDSIDWPRTFVQQMQSHSIYINGPKYTCVLWMIQSESHQPYWLWIPRNAVRGWQQMKWESESESHRFFFVCVLFIFSFSIRVAGFSSLLLLEFVCAKGTAQCANEHGMCCHRRIDRLVSRWPKTNVWQHTQKKVKINEERRRKHIIERRRKLYVAAVVHRISNEQFISMRLCKSQIAHQKSCC